MSAPEARHTVLGRRIERLHIALEVCRLKWYGGGPSADLLEIILMGDANRLAFAARYLLPRAGDPERFRDPRRLAGLPLDTVAEHCNEVEAIVARFESCVDEESIEWIADVPRLERLCEALLRAVELSDEGDVTE